MKAILNVFKSRSFLVGLAFVLLIGLVLALGTWLDWSMTIRLLGVIGVMLMFIVVLALNFVRANNAASAIEESIKMQAAQQRMTARPDRQGDIEDLQRELERAIEMLKQSKLGKRTGSGRAALYALPWYMIIGPPAAGKTTAIANSGLNFPIGKNAIRGVGGTRNCDWFFSDQAILLDTAGRYMTEHEDSDEWLAFLDVLKKHRKERPINGVLVGISVAELAEATLDEIEWHADNIRQRIDELIQHFGIRFPVYLLFTKCDLLQGFVEFFGELSRSEREQVWGSTFDKKTESSEVLELFNSEFDLLHERLLDARSMRLSRSMKREDRRTVYVFPLEFASMKDRLSTFVSRLFQPNPYQESPILRGFYFTSGTQEGKPIDRVIQSIARQVNLPAAPTAYEQDAEMETKSYFIKELFMRVIVPDQYLVAQTSTSQRRGRMAQVGVGAAAAVCLVLFLVASSQALLRSQLDIVRVEEAAAAAVPVHWDRDAATVNLERMERLRSEVSLLENRERKPPWLRLGLYRGGTVLEPARRLYLDRTHAFVSGQLFPALLDRLSAPSRTVRLEGDLRQRLHDDLRAYRLMTTEQARLEDEHNREMLREHLRALASERVPILAGEPGSSALNSHLAYYVDGLRNGYVKGFAADENLISRVRTAIFQAPSVVNLYEAMKEQATGELPPFTLADAVPAHYLSYFGGRPEVPGFFTKTGWEQYVRDAIAEQSKDPERADWVMGYSVEDLPPEMRDQQRVAEQLEELYFNEYAARWERFLRSVQVRPIGDARTGARQLADLGSEFDSPIVWVLAHVTDQTTFEGGSLADLQDRFTERAERAGEAQVRNRTGVVGAVSGREDEAEMHPITRRFLSLHELKANAAASGGAAAGLYDALRSLTKVSEALSAVAANGDAHAAEYAAGVFESNGGEIAGELQTIGRVLGRLDGDIRAALFENPIRQGWAAVVRAAQNHLNNRWHDSVFTPFQSKLADVYPFRENVQGALLSDVESFFHPENGAVRLFVAEELQPFLGRDGEPRRYEGQSIAISSTAKGSIAAADRITGGLFNGGVMRLDLEIQPELVTSEGGPAPGGVYLRIHGAEDTYRMGSYRPWTTVNWPGGPGASLMLSTQQGNVTVAQFEGDWALFRLLQQAQIQRRSGSEYELSWSQDYAGQGRVYIKYNLRARTAPELYSDPRAFFNLSVPESLN